MHKKK